MIAGLSFIEERFIEEMEEEPPKKWQLLRQWRNTARGMATAAALILIIGGTVALQELIMREETTETSPEVMEIGGNETDPSIAREENQGHLFAGGSGTYGQDMQIEEEIYCEAVEEGEISPEKLYLNEIEAVKVVASNEAERGIVLWNKEDIIQYYGKDPEPMYIPQNLEAAAGNGKANVTQNSKGELIDDVVSYDYYTADTGLTESVENVKCGFSMSISKKKKEPAYCVNLGQENEIRISQIAGMDVILGYDADGTWTGLAEESVEGCEVYTAQFEKDDCYYQIVAKGIDLTELIAVIERIP